MLGWLWLHEMACPILDESCVPVGTAQFSFVMCFSHNFAAKERQEGSSSKQTMKECMLDLAYKIRRLFGRK